MSPCQYKKSNCWDKTVVRLSYFCIGTSCTGKMTSLYWISPGPGSEIVSGNALHRAVYLWEDEPTFMKKSKGLATSLPLPNIVRSISIIWNVYLTYCVCTFDTVAEMLKLRKFWSLKSLQTVFSRTNLGASSVTPKTGSCWDICCQLCRHCWHHSQGCHYDNLRCRQWPHSWHHDELTTLVFRWSD